MNTKLNLQESILARSPNADLQIISELSDLVEKHNISWVPSSSGKGSYFIMSELAKAKGLNSDDYRRNWSSESTTGKSHLSSKDSSSEFSDNLSNSKVVNSNLKPKPVRPESTSSEKGNPSLPGISFKFEGEELKKFKQLYQEYTGINLGRINSLWVGNFEHAYSYLVQGVTKTATDFQSLGSNAITKSINEELLKVAEIDPLEEVTKNELYNSGYKTERELVKDLVWAASFGPYELRNEFPLEDFAQSKCETRRPDFVHIQPHKTKGLVVTAYEVKKNVIDHYDLVSTVEGKRYIELLKVKFNTNHVDLIFIAPYGGTSEALVKAMDYPNVKIQTSQEFTIFLLEKSKKWHTTDPYFVNNLLRDDESISKLLKHPALAPATPRPVLKSA